MNTKTTFVMPRVFLLALLILPFQFSFADIPTKKIDSKIDSVVVFLSGAEVMRKTSISVPAGRSKVVLQGLTNRMNGKSVQVSLGNGVNILSVGHKIGMLENKKLTKKIKTTLDSIADFDDRMAILRDETNVYTEEKNLLLTNKKIGGTNTGVPIDELEKAANLYRTRLMDINKKLHAITKKNVQIGQDRQKVQQRLYKLQQEKQKTYGEVILQVDAEAATKTDLSFRYLVTGAGWAPSYDVRATEIGQPIDLTYKASIYNNTGIEWDNVMIRLTTTDPNQGATVPVLMVWTLEEQQLYKAKAYGMTEDADQSGRASNYMSNVMAEATAPPTGAILTQDGKQFVEITTPELAVEFNVPDRQNISADGQPQTLRVTEYGVDAIYDHIAIPKLDKDAFLIAKILGWEDLNLIEGPASIYFGDTYLGESYINTGKVSDTLRVSLGRDKRVMISRTKRKDYEKKRIIGGTVKETLIFEIAVKNNRKQSISIDIEDQLPIPGDSEIKVEAVEISEAKLEELSGKLTWHFDLAPGESKRFTLEFTVKYPKDKNIVVSNTKVMYSPRF